MKNDPLRTARQLLQLGFVVYAAFILWLALALSACAIARPATAEAPVMPYPTLSRGNLGQTTCSFNNQPVVLMDSVVLVSVDAEIILVHEQTHAARIKAYKGGCWPFMLRYAKDTTFRADEEFAAYCAEGRFALTRNREPEWAWRRVANAMLERHNRMLTAKDNCLYQP